MTYTSPSHHRDASIRRFSAWASAKYDTGQAEHGGRFWRKPVLRYMRDEVVDIMFYYMVLEEQHRLALDYLDKFLDEVADGSFSLSDVESARCVLRYGNPEGETEEEHNGPKDDFVGGAR